MKAVFFPTVHMHCSPLKNFKLKSVSSLYHVQYFMGTLPVNYALDLRKLNFLQMLSAHHTSVMNLLFSLTARKEFELLCKNYLVTQPQAHGRFSACVWQAFVCHLAGFYRATWNAVAV